MIHSYSSPFAVGHAALERYEDRPGLFEGEVVVQEKIDGSQFSFRLVDHDGGELQFRSRNAEVFPEDAGLFSRGVQAVKGVHGLKAGYVYRGEYLAKPKHNTLAYGRVPKKHVVLFDIELAPYTFAPLEYVENAAADLGFDFAPVLFEGVATLDLLRQILADSASILGGPVEGLVIKPKDHALWGRDKKVLMAKLVAEDFKEKHETEWKKSNPGKTDILASLVERYRTEARWAKAVQHLRELGALKGEPSDIGLLMREVPEDILRDSTDEIRDALFDAFSKQVLRGATKGLPEWYKRQLAEGAFK